MKYLAMFFVAFLIAGVLAGAASIDKPREPVPFGAWVLSVVFTGLLVWLIWSAYL